jgi:superfamily I DNA/RNA helicase
MKLIVNNKRRIAKTWGKSDKEGDLSIIQTRNQIETNEEVLNRIQEIRKIDKSGSILILSPVGFASKSLIPMLIEKGFEPNDCWNKKIDIEDLKLIWLLRAIYSDNQILNLILYSFSLKLFSKPRFISGLLEHFKKDANSKDFKQFVIGNLNLNNEFEKYFSEIPELELIKSEFPKFIRIIDFIDPIEINKTLNNIFQTINPKIDFKKGRINLMSIHKSKGLQAEYVFIVGLVSGILPNENYGLDTIEAQRRLLFVGMSRTLKELFIISNIYWKAEYIHKVDKKQFKFAHWIKGPVKKYVGKMSAFIEEINS